MSNEAVHNDAYEIPVSKGIPLGVAAALVSCALVAVVIMGLVIFASHEQHVWPWSEAMNVQLTAPKH
jgi:hypothetical protein